MPAGTWWNVTAGWGWLVPVHSAWPWTVVAVLVGLCLGSFLNVVIHRLPLARSIVWPASACPACGRLLAPWENVPVLSYVILLARCRGCRAPISWRYPAVELAGGAILGLLVWRLGPGPAAGSAAAFSLFLLAIAWIDAEHRLIPDELSAGLLAFGLWARGLSAEGLAVGLAGALLGFGGFWVVASGYRRIRGIDGLGGGDVKLAAGLGAFLGPPGLLLTVLIASTTGSLAGLWLIVRGRGHARTALPFGSYLAAAAALSMAAGPLLWGRYLEWFGLRP